MEYPPVSSEVLVDLCTMKAQICCVTDYILPCAGCTPPPHE